MKNKILIVLTCLPLFCNAQVKLPIGFLDYMERVREKNLTYAAEKLNIPISQADVQAAKVFNDPSISFEYANNDDHNMQMGQGYSLELSKTFSLGKRRARVDLAKSEKDLSTALLNDFFRNLRADATIAYLQAIKQTQQYEVTLNSYNSINNLATADSIKFMLGKITEVDAMQSNVEAGVMRNELLQAQSDLYRSYSALNIPLGQFSADTLYIPIGKLEIADRIFEQGELLATAINNRADLVAALKNVDIAKKSLKLAKRERNMDFDVALGYNYNTQVRNELAPAPKFNGVTIGVSIPLKFSNFNKGTVHSAQFKVAQTQNYYEQAELEVKTQVAQNYSDYTLLCSQVERFNTGMLERAKAVITGKIYSYNRGETSLLEVLNAQRTYNEVRALYIETLFNNACALVTLEQSVGIWDIEIK
ncbi:MAG: TolC family protein [Bacteroidales bacterium]